MDDEPMWVADRVVALTPGSAITIPETANEFAIKVDAMTMKMDHQYKEFQSRSGPNPDHNDDDIPIFANKQSGRPSGYLLSNTQPNPKGRSSKPYQPPQARNEHVNAVFTWSGKSYDPPVNPNDQQNDSETPINFDSKDEVDEPTPNQNLKIQNHIDVIDEILEEDFDALLDDGSKILHFIKGTILEEKLFAEFDEFMAMKEDTAYQHLDFTRKRAFSIPDTAMRMEQYLTHTDYALWEVIVNGDAPAIASASAEAPIEVSWNQGCKDLIGSNQDQEDANMKLLRSLPSAWNNITLIMRNKYDLDTMSMDDLYNNLKKTLAVLMKQLILLMKFLLLVHRDKLLPQLMLMKDGSQMTGGHAYHDGEEILKEDRKESEFQWQRNWHQGIRGIEMEMLQEGLYQWILL
ncbi:hypothetical protein Tco_1533920 [Tanacetum coccineum]